MHRQVLFPQSRLLDLTILLAGVDAIRVVTIQARCHVMRKFFFMFVSVQSAIKAHTHIYIYTHKHTHLVFKMFTHLPLSYLKMPGDTMFFLFDVPRLRLS